MPPGASDRGSLHERGGALLEGLSRTTVAISPSSGTENPPLNRENPPLNRFVLDQGRRRNVGSGDADEPRPMGRWLAVDLEQDAPNHDAIGSWIAVKVGAAVMERELTVGGGHASGQLVPVQFGLGAADRAEVRVTWPDGEVGPWQAVGADEVVRVERGASAAQPLTP